MAHFRHLDDLIREYLLFRGFTITLKSFDGELKVDKDRGFRIRYASYGFDAELNTLKKLEIEKKWKDLVNKERFDEKSKKKKFYVLSMFPYPSGNLHMGHVRVYTISDTAARFYRLKGLNVLHPIGFDSFGLPAENAARENKVDPEEWTSKNINKMRNQLKELGCNFDWEREIITSKPQYYKFTQLLFLLLYKHNLVYRKKANVNWDPVDKTVLADEQVDSQGRSWRSGALVEKKMLKQWFIKTTNFAEDLYDGLNDNLKDWRDVINLQKHWIGKCDGADFKFYIEPHKEITVWVEKPEHMKKAAFFAVSPQSVLASEITQNSFLRSRLFKKKIPIYITDEINYPEGCDLKLGIPSQNQEDKNFAIKHNIEFDDTSELDNIEERTIICNLAIKSNLGGYPKSSKLKDWLISRQRYWGTPIPIIHCPKCKEVPVPEEKLPVLLSHKNQKTSCPNCGSKADYESDTMDTFVDSSWYFLRYIDPDNTSELFSKEKAENLMPVDVYIGGKEHAILHLYYARFISHFLYSIGCLKYPEPFKSLLVQGMVMGKTYYVKESLKCIRSDQVEEKGKELFEKGTGLPVIERWEKMSKSKHNGVEPSEILKKYGTDTTRLIILSEVAPTSNRQWNEKTSSGILNWQQRLWVLMSDFLKARNEYKGDFKENEKRLYEVRNTAVKGTSFSYASSHQFSAAISRMQSLTNSLKKFDVATMAKSGQFERTLASLLVMLFPMAPHFTSELWSYMQKAPNRIDNGKFFDFDKPIQEQQWPQLDDSFPLNLVCKVNNAVKAIVEIPSRRLSEMSKEEALNIMLQQSQVREFIACCDILSSQYNYENFEGTISILIDHVERRKFISKEKCK